MPVSYYGDLSGESSSDDSEGSSDDDESSSSALEVGLGRGGGGAHHQNTMAPHDTVRLSPSFTTNQNHTRMSTSQDDIKNGTDDNVPPPLEDIWSRCILHLDIDCFYCQCEEIDRKLEHPRRPLAIGQKHIIVTCNYEARRYGVKKLQSRESAMAACAHLLIVEGSDLLRYNNVNSWYSVAVDWM